MHFTGSKADLKLWDYSRLKAISDTLTAVSSYSAEDGDKSEKAASGRSAYKLPIDVSTWR